MELVLETAKSRALEAISDLPDSANKSMIIRKIIGEIKKNRNFDSDTF